MSILYTMSECLRLTTCWRFELTAASYWNSWHQNGDPRWPSWWRLDDQLGWTQHSQAARDYKCVGGMLFPIFCFAYWSASENFRKNPTILDCQTRLSATQRTQPVNFAYLKSSFRAIAATDQLQSLKLRGRSSCWSFWSQAQRWSWWSVGQENAKKGQNIPKHLISNMDQYIVSIKMDAPNI